MNIFGELEEKLMQSCDDFMKFDFNGQCIHNIGYFNNLKLCINNDMINCGDEEEEFFGLKILKKNVRDISIYNNDVFGWKAEVFFNDNSTLILEHEE